MASVQIGCTECLAKTCEGDGKTLCSELCLRCTSEILALVEFLSCALLAYYCLVARYESGKESSVSVCHNSKVDLVNNRSVAL